MLIFSKFFAKIDVSTSSRISFVRFALKITPSNFDIHEIFVSLTICLNSGNVGLLFISSWYDNILAIEIATSPFYGTGHDAGTILGSQRDSSAGFEFSGEEGDKGQYHP